MIFIPTAKIGTQAFGLLWLFDKQPSVGWTVLLVYRCKGVHVSVIEWESNPVPKRSLAMWAGLYRSGGYI